MNITLDSTELYIIEINLLSCSNCTFSQKTVIALSDKDYLKQEHRHMIIKEQQGDWIISSYEVHSIPTNFHILIDFDFTK